MKAAKGIFPVRTYFIRSELIAKSVHNNRKMGCGRTKVVVKTKEKIVEISIQPGMFVKVNPRSVLFSDEYTLVKKLGGGALSGVYFYSHKGIGIHRAVKIFNKKDLTQREAQKQFSTELRILGSLDHPKIIKVFESF